MAIFTGVFAAVAMDFFFDPVNVSGPAGFLWTNSLLVKKLDDSFQVGGWPLSAASPNTLTAFYVFGGKVSTPTGGSLEKMKGTLTSINEFRINEQGGVELFWQVKLAEGMDAAKLTASPSLGKAMQVLFSGDDKITGSSADDTLYGFKGEDRLIGLTGNDYYVIDSAGDRIVENEGEGLDYLDAYVNYNLGATSKASIEKIFCSGKCKTISGNSKNNFIYGNEAKNKLNGNSGKDVLSGVAYGKHPLAPNVDADGKILEADELHGGAGNDLIFGFGGKDKLTGGSGKDIFCFNTPPTNKAAAKIADFSPGADHIALAINKAYDNLTWEKTNDITKTVRSDYYSEEPASKLNYAKLKANEFAAIGSEDALLSIDGNVRVIYEKNTGKLYYDPDGNGKASAKLITTLSKKPALSAENIYILGEAKAFEGVYE